jgi:hypothetical protein
VSHRGGPKGFVSIKCAHERLPRVTFGVYMWCGYVFFCKYVNQVHSPYLSDRTLAIEFRSRVMICNDNELVFTLLLINILYHACSS